jgi:hypothetical protein
VNIPNTLGRQKVRDIWLQNGLDESTIDPADVAELDRLLAIESDAAESVQRWLCGIRALALRKRIVGW